MTSSLEASYRRLLRAYPGRWRQQNGEAALATLLDLADAAGRTKPSRADVVDLVGHGLAARVGAPLERVPVEVRNRVAGYALGSAAVLSLALFVLAEVLPTPYPQAQGWRRDLPQFFGPFATVGVLLYVPLVLAFVASLVGRRRVARVCLASTAPAAVAVFVLPMTMPIERPPTYLVVALCVTAVLARVSRSPFAAVRRDLVAAAAVTGVVVVIAFGLSTGLVGYWENDVSWRDYRWPVVAYRSPSGFLGSVELLVSAAVVVGAVWAAVASVRRPGRVVAVFVVGAVWSLMPLANSMRYDRWAWEDNYVGVGFVGAVGLLVAAAVVDLFRAAGRPSVGSVSGPGGVR